MTPRKRVTRSQVVAAATTAAKAIAKAKPAAAPKATKKPAAAAAAAKKRKGNEAEADKVRTYVHVPYTAAAHDSVGRRLTVDRSVDC